MFARVRLADGSAANFGWGWMVGEHDEHRVVHAVGHSSGFRTALYHWPDDQVSVLVLANVLTFHDARVCYALGRLALGLPPVVRHPVALSPTLLARAVGLYSGRGLTFEVAREGVGLRMHWRTPPSYARTWRHGRHLLPLSETLFYFADEPESAVGFAPAQQGQFTTFSFVNVLEPVEAYTATRVSSDDGPAG